MKKMAIVLAGILAAGAVYAADATTAGGIVTNAKGKIEWKSTVFNNVAVKDGDTATALIAVDNTNAYEPMAEAAFSGTVLNTFDAKLVLRANKDDDASYLELSKTMGDTYVKWNSDLRLHDATLFSALMKGGSLTVKKTMKETVGQVKAVVDVTDGKLAVDTKSTDTYIKYTPGAGALSFTFRPYDIEWKVGDEFENENLDKVSYGNTSWMEYFDNSTGDLNQEGGLEVEYKLGTSGKVFGAFSGLLNGSVEHDNGDKDSGSEFYVKAGAELTPADGTKIVPTLLFGSGSDVEENVKDESESYIAVNVDAETKMGTMKLEGELDFRNYSYEEAEADVTEGANQLGVMGKVTLDMAGLAPYAKLKFTSLGYTTEAAGTTTNENTTSGVEVCLGADKKVEALTLNAELVISSASWETDNGVVKADGSATGLGLGVKATYEF